MGKESKKQRCPRRQNKQIINLVITHTVTRNLGGNENKKNKTKQSEIYDSKPEIQVLTFLRNCSLTLLFVCLGFMAQYKLYRLFNAKSIFIQINNSISNNSV